jgi:hypothetical protein
MVFMTVPDCTYQICVSNVGCGLNEHPKLRLKVSKRKSTLNKESNRFDLSRSLWISEGRFNTDDDLPIQTLGHIQHPVYNVRHSPRYIHSHTIDVGVSFTKN